MINESLFITSCNAHSTPAHRQAERNMIAQQVAEFEKTNAIEKVEYKNLSEIYAEFACFRRLLKKTPAKALKQQFAHKAGRVDSGKGS